MSFFSTIFPIFALNALDNLRRSSCTQTFNHCSNHCPNSHPRRITPLNSQWDSPIHLQKISLKVNDTYLIWKEYVQSPRDLKIFLSEFERCEYYQGRQSPELLAHLQIACEIVDHATATFENVQCFEKKLIKMKNELRRQESTEQVQKQLSLVKHLLREVAEITLPKKLTQDNVVLYEIQAQEKLQDFERQIAMAEQPIIHCLSSENEKTKAIGTTIIVPDMIPGETDKISDKNTENIVETVEAPIGPIEEGIEPIIESVIEPVADVEKEPTPVPENSDQLEESSSEEPFTQIPTHIGSDPFTSEEAPGPSAEEIPSEEPAQQIPTLVTSEEPEAPIDPEAIKKDSLERLEIEKCNVQQAIAKANENEAFLHNNGFYKLAEHNAQYIQKLKNVLSTLTKDSGLEEFKQNSLNSNTTSGLSPSEEKELSEIFNRLYASEREFNVVNQQAAEKIEEWKKHHQFSLIDELKEVSRHIPTRNNRKPELPLNVDEINAFISATDELSKKIKIVITKKEIALIDLIALYEETHPERAIQVRKYFVSQLKHEVLTFINLLESNFPLNSKSSKSEAFDEAVRKILDQTYPLLSDFKDSSKYFGMNKKQEAIAELPLMDLVKYALEIKNKLDACKTEYESLINK